MARNNDRLFVDSNYFVSLASETDTNYQQACSINQQLKKNSYRLVLSSYIFSEVTTVLAQRIGKSQAIEVGNYILKSNSVEMLIPDAASLHETWKIFIKDQRKNLSFVDASIVSLMRAEGISTLLTFDRNDFKKLSKEYHFLLYPID